jgi:hypothetical protein
VDNDRLNSGPNHEARASDHESKTRQQEQEAANEAIPHWVLAVLIVCVIFTLLWVSWLILLVF